MFSIKVYSSSVNDSLGSDVDVAASRHLTVPINPPEKKKKMFN